MCQCQIKQQCIFELLANFTQMKSPNANTPAAAAAAAAAQWRPSQVGWLQHTASQSVLGVVRVQRSRVVNPGPLVPVGLATERQGGSQGALLRHHQAPAGRPSDQPELCPGWSAGSRPLPHPLRPGHQGTACCLGIPRTQRTQGWSRPGSRLE